MTNVSVVMYTTLWCPYCERARQLLDRKAVAFTEINLEARPAARAEMIERSGGRRTVPQIFVGDIHVGGSDELYALEAAGELDRLLQGSPSRDPIGGRQVP
jgi:glutaredoxin 3